jgi:hypothetical protein
MVRLAMAFAALVAVSTVSLVIAAVPEQGDALPLRRT